MQRHYLSYLYPSWQGAQGAEERHNDASDIEQMEQAVDNWQGTNHIKQMVQKQMNEMTDRERAVFDAKALEGLAREDWFDRLVALAQEVDQEALRAFGRDDLPLAEELGVVADELDSLRWRWLLRDAPEGDR